MPLQAQPVILVTIQPEAVAQRLPLITVLAHRYQAEVMLMQVRAAVMFNFILVKPISQAAFLCSTP